MLQRVMPGLVGMTHIMAFDDEALTEIEQFRREIIERTGDRGQAECLSDQDSATRSVEHRRRRGPTRGLHLPRSIGLDAHRALGRP